MYLAPKVDPKKPVTDPNRIESPVSSFQPDEKTRDVTALVQKDFIFGFEQLSKPRREFNDRSLITEIDVNQKAFNSYVPPKSEDPDGS